MSVFNHPAGKTIYAAGEKAAGREVAWARDNLEALFNNTAELIWAINKERYYLYTNSAYRDAVFAETGIIPQAGDHIHLNSGFSAGQIREWEKYYSRAFNGEIFTARTESLDKAGRPVYFEVGFNPLCKTKGKVTSIGCFARNITDLVETEKAIIDQNERLRHIASISSHELRRPVASLLGLINIIDKENFDSPDNKEIIGHLLTVGKEIDDVIRLIINKTFADDPSASRYQTP